MAIWRVCIACWILKPTRTHSEYVIRFAFPLENGYTNAPQCYVTPTLPVLLLVTNNINKATINNNDRRSLFPQCFNNLFFL